MSTHKTHAKIKTMKPTSVITLTPNPTLDLSGEVETLIVNEKNSVLHERRDPGGNGINAARIAKRLAQPSRVRTLAIGFLGGAVGEEIKALLNAEKLPTRWIKIEGNTRINVTVSLNAYESQSQPKQTRLSFPGPGVSKSEANQMLRLIERLPRKSILLLGGSLPRGLSPDFWLAILKIAAARGIGCIVDTPAPILKAILESLERSSQLPPLLAIKPNLHELGVLLNRDLSNASLPEIIRASRPLTHRVFGICVSMGAKGALWVDAKHAWFIEAPPIQARGTVGAGDSFLGAFATRMAEVGLTHPDQLNPEDPAFQASLLEALRLGSAAGAATAESLGTQLAKKSDILRLLAKVPVAKRVG